MSVLIKIADSISAVSLANKLRNKRFLLFLSIFKDLNISTILDIGGTELYWENRGFKEKTIIIVNKIPIKTKNQNIHSVVADARNLSMFNDKSIDLVYSNSVIEHLSSFEGQKEMANEIRRIAKRYYVQTPCFYFPLEPHFLFPFFQFFPVWVRVILVMKFSLGWYQKFTSKSEAFNAVNNIRLLKKKELKTLFPESIIYAEKFFGITKSYVVVKDSSISVAEMCHE
ncbi:MAG: methyltransferase domain-containing protein [Melioribacteraceae bacterium]